MKSMLKRFIWILRHSFDPTNRHCASYETFCLQKKLEEKQRDNRYLHFQLAQTRAEKYELERKPFDLRDAIAGILNKPEEQLRSSARFPVWKAESGTDWEVVTGHCCLGGCDMDICSFQSERDALLFASLLDAVGYHAPHNIACPACYAEYMKDRVGGEMFL